MKQLSYQTVKHLNALACSFVCFILIMAQFLQISLNELPCPLCLLQRVGFIGLAFGFLLNAYDRPHQLYYFVSILGAMFTFATGLRQVLLHIAPNTGSYGSAFLGLHLYTWSVVFSGSFLIVIIFLLLFGSKQFDNKTQQSPSLIYRYLFMLVMLITLINTINTFSICGLSVCPSSPTHYIWSGYL